MPQDSSLYSDNNMSQTFRSSLIFSLTLTVAPVLTSANHAIKAQPEASILQAKCRWPVMSCRCLKQTFLTSITVENSLIFQTRDEKHLPEYLVQSPDIPISHKGLLFPYLMGLPGSWSQSEVWAFVCPGSLYKKKVNKKAGNPAKSRFPDHCPF